jgi:hypothetical protein
VSSSVVYLFEVQLDRLGEVCERFIDRGLDWRRRPPGAATYQSSSRCRAAVRVPGVAGMVKSVSADTPRLPAAVRRSRSIVRVHAPVQRSSGAGFDYDDRGQPVPPTLHYCSAFALLACSAGALVLYLVVIRAAIRHRTARAGGQARPTQPGTPTLPNPCLAYTVKVGICWRHS